MSRMNKLTFYKYLNITNNLQLKNITIIIIKDRTASARHIEICKNIAQHRH